MAIAQRQAHGKHRARGISAVVGINSSVVHVDNHLAQVEPNARAVYLQPAGVGTLIETVKNVLQIVILQAYAAVDNLQLSLRIRSRQAQLHIAAILIVLKGIRQ